MEWNKKGIVLTKNCWRAKTKIRVGGIIIVSSFCRSVEFSSGHTQKYAHARTHTSTHTHSLSLLTTQKFSYLHDSLIVKAMHKPILSVSNGSLKAFVHTQLYMHTCREKICQETTLYSPRCYSNSV